MMKTDDIKDYDYELKQNDLANLFHVEQTTNKDGSINTFYNLNDGFSIDGVESLPSDSVEEYTCKSNDELRFISYDLYGTTEYWWLIAKINGMEDCTVKLKPGQKIKYLPKYYLSIIISKIREGI